MTQPEDNIHWGKQLEQLPQLVKSVIIAIRLGGQTTIILLLVGIFIASYFGLFTDRASVERAEMIKEAREQTLQIKESQNILERQLKVFEGHIETTKALALTACASLQKNTTERTECLTLLRH